MSIQTASTKPASTKRAGKTKSPTETNPLALLGRSRRDRWLIQIGLIVLALWWAFPLITVVQESLKVEGLANYRYVLTADINGVWLPRTFVNSFIVAGMHALLVCSVGSLAGYAFSRMKFPGREFAFYSILAVLAVPATALLIPIYYLSGTAGLFNTHIGVALPEAALTMPFAMLLMRNFGDGLSASYFEAAAIDGASHWQMYRNIFLPIARPTLVNLGALTVMWSFHDFALPSLIMQEPDMTTAAQAVQTIRGAFSVSPLENARFFAALGMLALPALFLVIFGLRWMTGGLTAGGTKE